MKNLSLGLTCALARLLLFSLALPIAANAQEDGARDEPKAPTNWHLLDPELDKVPGISAERAYRELLAGKKPKRVRVAIIDSGFDTTHTDLRDRLWRNPGEIAGNGQDDDRNGYVDDVVGWNFIGAADGRMVGYDTYELTREYTRLKGLYPTAEAAPTELRPYYTRVMDDYNWQRTKAQREKDQFDRIVQIIRFSQAHLREQLGEPLNAERVKAFVPKTEVDQETRRVLLVTFERNIDSAQIARGEAETKKQLNYALNADFDGRAMVDDEPSKLSQRHYGNPDVGGSHQEHGTHVAGIVAAQRDNNADGRGVADAVEIICIRAVPDGDERDKDVANAIRYATDQGARIINMSFGKSYSPHKALVDSAVRYAVSRGVLLVHGAGNEGQNSDLKGNFPNRRYADGGAAETWLEVGANNWSSEPAERLASFTNYGKTTVDLLAPGVAILSLKNGGGTEENDGTSMAAPVVSGVAAVVWAHYPELSALELRAILLESVTPMGELNVDVPVDRDARERREYEAEREGKEPKPEKSEKARLKELLRTPGVVNLYRALKLAEQRSRKKAG